MEDEEQGQEALLVQEARHRSFRRRVVVSTKSVLLPTTNDDDTSMISKESFEKALLARHAVEGSAMSAELKHVLNDAVQKGLVAVEKRQLERAKQLLEFIIVPPPATKDDNDAVLPNVDTVSSLGFDRSFDVNKPSMDVLSMSSLNEILDAPLTPERTQQQARFRRFWFGKHKKPVETNLSVDDDDDNNDDESTTSPERFVTTVVCNDGTMLPEKVDESSLHRIEEELQKSLDDISTHKDLTSANGVPLHTPPQQAKIDTSVAEEDTDALDASQIMENLNDSRQSVTFIAIETTAVDETVDQEPPRQRSQSPLKRLLHRRSSKKAITESTESPVPTDSIEEIIATEELPQQVAVSPTTDIHVPVDDRYAIEPVPSEEEEVILDSDMFLNRDDRYAVPADPCSFCDSLWRDAEPTAPDTLIRTNDADEADDDTPAEVDKYADISVVREDENSEQANTADVLEKSNTKKKKKRRFALFRRRKNKIPEISSRSSCESSPPKKPLQGILKAPSKSFPVDETASLENLPPATDGGSTSTVTSHEDDAEPDPLLDRLKQQQRGLDPAPPEQRHQRLDP